MERVGKMEIYQEKIKLKYHTVDEANAIWKKGENRKTEEIAKKLIKNKIPIEVIVESTGLSIKKVQQMAKRYNKDN
jgi:hypothetical protein